jgi:hypothetical protein
LGGVVDGLFRGIDALVIDEQASLFRVEQLKEKFGTLRVYVSFDRTDPAGVNAASATLDALVDTDVAASEMTCCVCGKPGRMRSLVGWSPVRCDSRATVDAEPP